MKIHVMSLLLGVMACLCVFIVSCKDDLPNDPNEQPAETGNTAWFSIKITGAGGISTKALQTEEGTADESKVNSVLVALYNTSTGNVEYQFRMNIHSGASSVMEGSDLYQGNTAKRFQTVAKQVKRQDYNLLVVLNPREAILTATAEGSNISAFKTAVALNSVEDLTGERYDNFLMCNWQDLVLADADTYIFPSKEEALATPVPVSVERAVGKVIVGGSAKGKIYSFEGWALNVTNRKTYWMRQPWMAIGNDGTGVTNEESPDVNNRYLNYAKDPNAARDQYAANAWHSYGAWVANSATGDAPAYLNGDFTFTHSASAAWKPVGTANWLYAPENTMEAAQQYGDVSTSVVLKIKYNPAKSALGAAVGADTPYYIYYGGKSRYTFTAAELEAEYVWQQGNGGKPQTYTDPLIQEFMNHIGQYRAVLGEGVAFTAYAADASNISCNLRRDFAFFDSAHLNYYRIPIPHFSKAEQPDPMGYGRYGVVRNNVYRLTVDDVLGPGTAEIAPWKSGDPDGPGNPGDPDGPANPDYPGGPVYPGDPGYPGKPVYPGDPDYPDNPSKPGEPVYPGDPGYPGKPVYPGDPDYPDDTPGDPDIPGNHGGPNDPDDPKGPVAPGNPGNPVDPVDPNDDPGGGDPPPDPPPGGGDDDTYWLSFRVKILDWTIRTHGVSAGGE
jgi:hypothetical protein